MKTRFLNRILIRRLTYVLGVNIAAGVILVFPSLLARAQAPDNLEYKIKAAYLYNLIKFVDWPSSSFLSDTSELSICVLGQSPLNNELLPLQERSLKGRQLRVRILLNLDEVQSCHLLFISKNQREQMASVLARLQQRPVLTVSEIESFIDSLGMIGFILRDNAVKIEANVDVAEKSSLFLHSDLLEVCVRVIKNRSGMSR